MFIVCVHIQSLPLRTQATSQENIQWSPAIAMLDENEYRELPSKEL